MPCQGVKLCEQYGDQMTAARSGQASGAATRQVTIQDVARPAAVSRQTVSNVLHAAHKVKPATRQRVEQAIATLSHRLEFTIDQHDVVLRGTCPTCR